MIASSSSSPPTRTDCDTTIPPSEITATSEVPPPMSTIMLPVGSPTGSPAPIAAAIGSSMREARRGGGRHRLLEGVGLAGAGRQARLLDRALLHPGHAGGHADHDARVRPAVL